MFFVFTLLAEWRPVPIDPAGNRLVSLAFVFIIASRLIFGWEWSVLIGAGAIGLAMAGARSEPLKVAFNAATYAIAGAVSSLALLDDAAGRARATRAWRSASCSAARSSSSPTC